MLKVHFLAVVISYVSAKRKYNVRYKEVKNAEGLKSLMKGQENRFTTCERAFFSELVSHKHASKRCIRFFFRPRLRLVKIAGCGKMGCKSRGGCF